MNSALFSRRQMLKVGALGGLTLSQYMRLQASAKEPSQKRSGIFIFLEGGPSHQDTFDLKPDAPSEYRGEFKPIPTSVPGIQICEHLPELAKRAKDYAIIRGLSHTLADHGIGKKYMLTGNRPSQTLSYPEYGAVVSKVHPSARDLPSYVSIDESFVGPGYLGNEYSALTANKPTFGIPYSVRGISLEDGLTVEKYNSQKKLLDDLDSVRTPGGRLCLPQGAGFGGLSSEREMVGPGRRLCDGRRSQCAEGAGRGHGPLVRLLTGAAFSREDAAPERR